MGLDGLAHDVREGVRRLARHPRFTMLATGTLALGLATSTAVFGYVSAYARSFPGVDADRLQQVWLATEDDPWNAVSYPDFQDLAELDQAVFTLTGFGVNSFGATVRRGQAAEVAFGQSVTRGFFSVLEIEMSAGRGFSADEDRAGAVPATILAHEYWATRYGSDPDVVGQTILLNNEPYTIVGVAGPGFLGADASYRPQFWIPMEQYLRVYRPGNGTRANREVGSVLPIVRMADGVRVARASNALRAFASGLDSEAPLADRSRRFVLEPATWIGPDTRDAEASTTRVLMGAAGFLLLLACANVANLVLSAGARRRSEMALRSAMGASRTRLVRQLLTESLLLSTLAGAVALILARPAGLRLSSYFARPSVWGVDVSREILISPRVMIFAFGIAVVTGVVTGLIPALRGSGRNPAESLGAGGTRSSTGGSARTRLPGTRELLISGQIAICVVLLFVAGLVLRTLETVRSVDAGFDTRQTLASYVSTSSMGVPIAERHRFYEDLMHRLDDLPWVAGATVAEYAPLSSHPKLEVLPPDRSDPVQATIARVWPGYFEVLDMEMVRGRSFLATDTVDAAGVVVVNEALARRLVGDADPIGRTLWLPGGEGEPDRGFEVVGVARDVGRSRCSRIRGPWPISPCLRSTRDPGTRSFSRCEATRRLRSTSWNGSCTRWTPDWRS